VQKVLEELKDPEIKDVLSPIPLSPEPCPDHDPAPFPHDPRRDPAAYFIEQLDGPLAAYGATPFLSPDGMVQPVLVAVPPPHYANTFTFLQGASEHSFPTGSSEDYEATFGAGNYEESLVCSGPEIFDMGLVNPTLATLMRRFERRLDLTLCMRIQIPRITLFPPSFTFDIVPICVTFPVWRRFYDLLTLGLDPGVQTPTTTDVTVTAGPQGVSAIPSVPESDPVASALSGDGAIGECTYAYRFVLPA
jgi:hypothetical protein